MATKSIGTASRDYSTIQAWEDSLIAVLIAEEIGECYNDSEFTVAGTVVTFSGSTTALATDIILRPASGQGFRDNASVQTNALKYNQSNGVGLRKTTAYGYVVVIDEDYVTVKGLQIQSGAGGGGIQNGTGSATHSVIEDCICEGEYQPLIWRSGTARNILVALRANGGDCGVYVAYPASAVFVNCTIVRPSNFTISASGIKNVTTGGMKVTNCAVFGFTNFVDSNTSMTGSNNCSDVTIGFGSSNQASKTYASQFQNTADSTRDFRAKAGANLLNNGATDTTDLPAADDIAGTARPSGASWDIGCWELVSAGAAFLAGKMIAARQAINRAGTF